MQFLRVIFVGFWQTTNKVKFGVVNSKDRAFKKINVTSSYEYLSMKLTINLIDFVMLNE